MRSSESKDKEWSASSHAPPGGSFSTSYCPLKAAVGSMQGSYQMVTTDGERFDAVIAPFTLAVPNALN